MRILLTISVGIIAIFSFESYALNKQTCTSDLFKNFELVENSGHSRVLARPKGNLKQFADRYEISCPWQLEADFNGDKTKDWVGIAQIEGRYELVAYISGPKKHYHRVIKQYDEFPSSTYLRVMVYKFLFKKMEGKIDSIFPASLTVLENDMNGNSSAYGWSDTKKELVKIATFNDRRNINRFKQYLEDLNKKLEEERR
ncbi:MAG: hypothetical protein OQK04_05370, partial [Kangiellaceae bacterium]|nr:hypothetical protein [Kangiellaceae bacterium]MCW8998124.1 hypothetical protein [Kangiellaceae bacterium]